LLRADARLARPLIRPGSESELTKRLTGKSVPVNQSTLSYSTLICQVVMSKIVYTENSATSVAYHCWIYTEVIRMTLMTLLGC